LGVAALVAVFTSADSYASAQEFSDGFVAASGACARLALLGVLAASALPRRRTAPNPRAADARTVPALETKGR